MVRASFHLFCSISDFNLKVYLRSLNISIGQFLTEGSPTPTSNFYFFLKVHFSLSFWPSFFLLKNQNAMTLAKQREYLRHYEIHLSKMVGVDKARETMKNALYILSMGTNDFLQNYFLEVIRSMQYTVEQYQNFLIRSLFTHVKVTPSHFFFNRCYFNSDTIICFVRYFISTQILLFVHQFKYKVIYNSIFQNLDISLM